MEKIKIKRINIALIIIVISLVIIPTIFYIINNHYNSMYTVIEKKIKEAAEKCNLDNICLDNKVTLKELIDNKYLDKIYDPKTKELINLESYVDLNTKEFKIVE